MANWYQGCGGKVNGVTEDEKRQDLEKLEQDGNWIAEPKYDGIWALAFTGEADGETKFLSRNDTFKNSPQLKEQGGLPSGIALVGELAFGSQESIRRKEVVGHEFMDVFDIIMYDEQDVSKLSRVERRGLLIEMYARYPQLLQWYMLAPQYETDFVKHYEHQHEGLILKPRDDGEYRGGKHRNKRWLKAKKCFSNEYVILGYNTSTAETKVSEPMAENIVVGGYVPKSSVEKELVLDTYTLDSVEMCLIPLMRVGAMTHDMCRSVAQNYAAWDRKVIEVNHYSLFKSGAARHPSVATMADGQPRLREKNPRECVYRV